jgi:osmoprotectant transport system substrate-binding protein
VRGRLAAAAAVASALLAGCSADVPEEDPIRPVDALTWNAEVGEEVEGAPIAVGSPSRPVDLVLGWVAVETLVAAGLDVTADLDLGDTQATREAQLAGLIDLYWETTGTGWLSLLREIGPSDDPEQLYRDVRDEDLDENAIVWLPPAPAHTGVGIVESPDAADDLGITTVGELAGALDDTEEGVVVCVSANDESLEPAGLAALADAADVRIRPRVINTVPDRRLIELTEEGTFCPFALVERIDPRLADADLELLEDDIGAFVAEQPAVTIREDTFDAVSTIDDLFEPVAAALDTETLQGLVGQVTEDGDDPREVARDWLVDEGFADRP